MKLPKKTWARVALATAASLMLIASTTLIVIGVANTLKTATLSLSAKNQNNSEIVSPSDTVTLTANISNQNKLAKGIAGLTMDISYDSTKLDYINANIENLLGENFDVSANEAVKGTVTVLVYADALDSDSRLYAAGNGNLFSLNFTVKDGVSGTCEFTPSACNYADYTGEENAPGSDFELIAVTPAPGAANVTAAAKALTGISLTSDPTLTYTYVPGLTFDKGSLAGVATYNNGGTKTLTASDFTADKTTLTYADNGSDVTLTYTENSIAKSVKKSLTVNKGILTAPTATAIDYSTALKLGDIVLSDSRWEWAAPNTKLDCANSGEAFAVNYKTTNMDKGNYSNETVNVSITVNKIAPVTPSLTVAYKSGMTLSNVDLSAHEGWTWDNASTIVTAGSHSYLASYAGSANYKAQSGIMVSVTAIHNGKDIPNITVNPTAASITYGQTLSESVLSGGAASVPGSFAWSNPADLTTPNAGTIQRSVTFTPTNTEDNETVVFNIEITVNKAIITVTPNSEQTKVYDNTPTSNLKFTTTGEVMGQKAAFSGSLTYNGGEKAGDHNIILGNLAMIDNGDFKAANYNLKISETAVNFVITKATPIISANPSAAAITYGSALSASALTGGSVNGNIAGSFKWADSNAVPTVSNTGYDVYFEPTDKENYNNSSNVKISVTVGKANPNYTIPGPLSIALKDGLKLSDVELPAGWSWVTPESTLMNDIKAYTFKAKFTPSDLNNFIAVDNIDITINVVKAEPKDESVASKTETSAGSEPSDNVKTGDAFPYGVVVLIILLSTTGMIVSVFARKSN